MSDQSAECVSFIEFYGYILRSNISLLTIKEVERDKFILLIPSMTNNRSLTLGRPTVLGQPQIFSALDICARFALRHFKIRTYSVDLLDPWRST